MSKENTPPVELQKEYEELHGEPAPSRYKNDSQWLSKKNEEKKAEAITTPGPEIIEDPAEAEPDPAITEDGVKTPAEDSPTEETTSANATRVVVTIDGLYKRAYTKEAHGEKFIDYAAEYCSTRDGAEFTLEK